jgi:predicted acylesterase/phospholipase RssA
VETGAWEALKEFLGDRVQGVRTAFLGKVGLALSGGGFRASLFHIGLLAKLAEMDMLRHVEVLSCVSGGSIIGAHYYLKVRDLFKRKGDAEIEQKDYVRIVQEICREFLEGVQTNIRTRMAAEFLTNLKMIFLPNYSRTIRVGELFEEQIYAKVQDGEQMRPRWLNDLFIQPKDEVNGLLPSMTTGAGKPKYLS